MHMVVRVWVGSEKRHTYSLPRVDGYMGKKVKGERKSFSVLGTWETRGS